MKYSSLKRQSVKSLKVKNFDGGVNFKNPNTDIDNNQLSDCNNMWFRDSKLQTRPGFYGESWQAVKTPIYGNTGELKYKVTDTEVYRYGSYYRIATADVLTDDYAHYTHVYLVDVLGNIEPIGYMSFLRLTSDIFYTPVNILFYNGKSENGGGVFALVTLQNGGATRQRRYYIYEIDETFSEWNRVEEYYIPTIYINGRGSLYETAHLENSFSAPQPQTLESLNMLNGKFNAYYTSDGYSSSFKLPFTNLPKKPVEIRIYYTRYDYVEWRMEDDWEKNTQKFMDKDISAWIDRTKGIVYFTEEVMDFAIPVMPKYRENNIKITTEKEIEDGFAKVVHSTCSVSHNSKLFLSGGQDGNTVFVTTYENPLYFPQGSSVSVGDADLAINALSVQDGKILAFKPYELYKLDVKSGEKINEISLLRDNDAIFKKSDKIEVSQISGEIGCQNKYTLSLCGNVNVWLGWDNCVYVLESLSSGKIVNICDNVFEKIPDYNEFETFAVGNDEIYLLICSDKIFVFDIKQKAQYIWTVPTQMVLQSGFYKNRKFRFLCTAADSTISYMTMLDGKSDIYMYYNAEEDICEAQIPIECSMTTKHFCPNGLDEKINIDNIYLSLSAQEKVQISVNQKEITSINFGFLGEEYNKHEHKAVRIIPHLYGESEVFLTIHSDNLMSIGEAEISYRITG